MKIAIDIRILADKRVGKASQLLYLLQGLKKVDEQNEYVLYSRKAPKDISLPKNARIKTKNIPMPLWHVWCWFDFSFVEKVDVFLSTLSFIIPSFSKKCVVLVHDMVSFLGISVHNKKAQTIEKITFRRAMKNARSVIAVSESTKKDIIKLFPIDEQKISVIHEAIDPEFYEPVTSSEIEHVMAKYRIESGYLFFLSTLEPRKNITRLIEAYATASSETHMPPLVMAGGKGWEFEMFEKRLKELQPENDIQLIGHVDPEDLRALYQASLAYVFPALYEGFGLTVLEAMASKKPVIVSSSGPLPEVAGEGAEYVDPYDVDDIAEKIVKVVQGEKLQAVLSEKGYQQAQRFDITKMAQETLHILKKSV